MSPEPTIELELVEDDDLDGASQEKKRDNGRKRGVGRTASKTEKMRQHERSTHQQTVRADYSARPPREHVRRRRAGDILSRVPAEVF